METFKQQPHSWLSCAWIPITRPISSNTNSGSTSVNVCTNTQYMMYKQELYRIAGVAVASAVIDSADSAASERFTNVLRLSHSRSPHRQAAQWTALAYVAVNRFVFSEGKGVQNINVCSSVTRRRPNCCGSGTVRSVTQRDVYDTRAA